MERLGRTTGTRKTATSERSRSKNSAAPEWNAWVDLEKHAAVDEAVIRAESREIDCGSIWNPATDMRRMNRSRRRTRGSVNGWTSRDAGTGTARRIASTSRGEITLMDRRVDARWHALRGGSAWQSRGPPEARRSNRGLVEARVRGPDGSGVQRVRRDGPHTSGACLREPTDAIRALPRRGASTLTERVATPFSARADEGGGRSPTRRRTGRGQTRSRFDRRWRSHAVGHVGLPRRQPPASRPHEQARVERSRDRGV